MRILLVPPKFDSPSFEIDHQIVLALVALHEAHIRIRGAGRFGEHRASILVECDDDTDAALTALNLVGIHAAVRNDRAQP